MRSPSRTSASRFYCSPRWDGGLQRVVIQHGEEVDLSALPTCPLEESEPEDRRVVAELIAKVAAWPGFGSSTATKLLHKKRPALIPVLDNRAIFGGYLNPSWGPGSTARVVTVKDPVVIRAALDQISVDLQRGENAQAWNVLAEVEPQFSRIELFDTVWWMYFREVQPVVRSTPSGE